MFCAILKATNSSFQKGMTFCRSIYVKKVMKLFAFIFEQRSYYYYDSYYYYYYHYFAKLSCVIFYCLPLSTDLKNSK